MIISPPDDEDIIIPVDPPSGGGGEGLITLATITEPGQAIVVATGREIIIDRDDAIITPSFDRAPIGSSAKGGLKEFYVTVDADGTRRTHNNRKLVDGTKLFSGIEYLGTNKTVLDNDPFDSLINGMYMFYFNAIGGFNIPLPSLVDGGCMFYQALIESFSVPLPALTRGHNMFFLCKLDKPSVLIILNSLQKLTTNPNITIGAAKACQGDADIAAAIASAQTRGWTVSIAYNG